MKIIACNAPGTQRAESWRQRTARLPITAATVPIRCSTLSASRPDHFRMTQLLVVFCTIDVAKNEKKKKKVVTSFCTIWRLTLPKIWTDQRKSSRSPLKVFRRYLLVIMIAEFGHLLKKRCGFICKFAIHPFVPEMSLESASLTNQV